MQTNQEEGQFSGLLKCMRLAKVIFSMLSDAKGQIGRIYGVFDKKIELEAGGHFVIDPEKYIQ
jgi:alkyl hydroperoxide reductase subunit AhpC